MEPAPVSLVTTSAGGTVNSANTGTGVLDVLVAEKVKFLLSKGKTKIGILSVTASVWSWYVGSLGDIRWVYSPMDIPGRLVGDPCWFCTGFKHGEEVEIILLNGGLDKVPYYMWKWEDLKFVIQSPCISWGQRKRIKTKPVPPGWEVDKVGLTHGQVGGVTSWKGSFKVAQKSVKPKFELILPPHVSP